MEYCKLIWGIEKKNVGIWDISRNLFGDMGYLLNLYIAYGKNRFSHDVTQGLIFPNRVHVNFARGPTPLSCFHTKK